MPLGPSLWRGASSNHSSTSTPRTRSSSLTTRTNSKYVSRLSFTPPHSLSSSSLLLPISSPPHCPCSNLRYQVLLEHVDACFIPEKFGGTCKCEARGCFTGPNPTVFVDALRYPPSIPLPPHYRPSSPHPLIPSSPHPLLPSSPPPLIPSSPHPLLPSSPPPPFF